MVDTEEKWRGCVFDNFIDVFTAVSSEGAVLNAMSEALNLAEREESDEYTHAGVMALYDRAIAAEDAKL